ncbi:MAG: hypothetical protein HY925_12050, partial [Elusimicrobia bacterium]|nr:hypothetical protein [Elusimicrobiota bacterium]
LIGGALGTLRGLWAVRHEGGVFSFLSPDEARRKSPASRPDAAAAEAAREAARAETTGGPPREFRGASDSTGASASKGVRAARGAGSRFETRFKNQGVESKGSVERSGAFASSSGPARASGPHGESSPVTRSARAAGSSGPRVFRSDTGIARRGGAESSDDSDGAPAGAPGAETSRHASGREAEGTVKLGKIADAGETREIEGLESTALMSKLGDKPRRDVLRVLDKEAEDGISGFEACQRADAAEECAEALRRCEADEACRRRYQDK